MIDYITYFYPISVNPKLGWGPGCVGRLLPELPLQELMHEAALASPRTLEAGLARLLESLQFEVSRV